MSDPAYYRAQAAKCRELADTTYDESVAANLHMLAGDCEEEARKLEGEPDPEPPPVPTPA